MKTTAYTPFQVGTRDRIVGIFVIAAVLLFLIGFLIPAIKKLSADEGIPFYTTLDQTYGIAKDAQVSLRGVQVGKVQSVGLSDDGWVRVDIALSPVYQDFYTRRSRLSVDTNLGVSTILTGSGLVLSPGSPDNGLMEPGEFIPTDTPQGLASILAELDIAQLADQVTDIITNVEDVTNGLSQNQEKIYASLDNLELVTANVAKVTEELPVLVDSVEGSLAQLESGLTGVNTLVVNVDKDLQSILKNAVGLTDQATRTLVEAETLFQATAPVMEQLPIFLITTDVALQSFTDLSDQMVNSWLFGGAPVEPRTRGGPTSHPHDDSLYLPPATSSVSSN